MNIEKLYEISTTLINDFSLNEIIGNLNNLVNHLNNIINQPNQPQHQQALSDTKLALYKGLNESITNKFNVIDISAAQELGVDKYIGVELLEKIDNVLSSNEITPSVAFTDITKIRDEFILKVEGLRKVITGFQDLNISIFESRSDFNLVVRIPRELIHNNLEGFAESLDSLNKNLLVFSEIAVGSRESLQISSLSTTDPTIVLKMAWDAGMLMLDILSKVAGIYAGVTVLKKQREEFIKNGAPVEMLAQLTEWINNQIKERINEVIPELVDKYHKVDDEERRNELKTEARRKALRIAENIDQGYTFDVKIPENSEQESEEISEAVEDAIKQLNSNNKLIERSKMIGSKILMLPKSDEDL